MLATPTGDEGRPQLVVAECFEEDSSYQDINKGKVGLMEVLVTLA